jgi:hypothetical protein
MTRVEGERSTTRKLADKSTQLFAGSCGYGSHALFIRLEIYMAGTSRTIN